MTTIQQIIREQGAAPGTIEKELRVSILGNSHDQTSRGMRHEYMVRSHAPGASQVREPVRITYKLASHISSRTEAEYQQFAT